MDRTEQAMDGLIAAIKTALEPTYSGGSDSLEQIANFVIGQREDQIHDLRRALSAYAMARAMDERFGK